ncbi:MAG TPA: DUF2116 family Zn-ribbon domain-containing protein [Candidatus Thermoplasmatota archaeon]|nr:DUF2116 family Zn-ribbon domain-containing protein [Candidatus Thermoplasmatota archaeon]
MPTVQIPNHSHCGICQRAVPYGDKTCSDDCEKKYQDLQRRRKRAVWTMYGLMALAFLVLVLSVYQPGLLSP